MSQSFSLSLPSMGNTDPAGLLSAPSPKQARALQALQQGKPKRARLEELFFVLAGSPKVDSAAAAWNLLDVSLRTIEDRQTELLYDPSLYGRHNRMYVPNLDSELWTCDGDWRTCTLFSHKLLVSERGDIRIIESKTGRTVFRTPVESEVLERRSEHS